MKAETGNRQTGPLLGPLETRTRTNTNPNDTEANAAGRSVRACVASQNRKEDSVYELRTAKTFVKRTKTISVKCTYIKRRYKIRRRPYT